MAKLGNLKPMLPVLDPGHARPAPSSRMTGRKLQGRRLRIWLKNPHCAQCGRLTLYPDGFELDHKVPLFQGGEDTDGNCQVLCPDCHGSKTAADLSG